MADLSLVSRPIVDILGFQAEAASNTAAAKGQEFSARGYAAEGEAYGTAADIATQNAALAAASGEIQAYQARRRVAMAIGSQEADIGGAGFTSGGSALAALKSSYQQGYLTEQLTRTRSLIEQGGYLETAVAARGEQKATGIAGEAATALGAAYTEAAKTAKTTAATETQLLMDQLAATGWGGSQEARQIEAILSGRPMPESRLNLSLHRGFSPPSRAGSGIRYGGGDIPPWGRPVRII